jgi:polar amino acid transport system substrate-binding protein
MLIQLPTWYDRPRGGRVFLLTICLIAWTGLAQSQVPELRGGWSPGIPYQFEELGPGDQTQLSGLDIEIMREASRRAGFRPVFLELPWAENLRGVQDGDLNFAMAATPVEARKEWAWFSAPYRTENIALFVRRGEGLSRTGEASIDALARLLAEGHRIGVIRGYFVGPEASALLTKEVFASQIVRVDNDARLVDALLTGAVDAILADRLATASTAWKSGALLRIEMLTGVLYQTPLSFIFSKASTSESTVEAFDRALEEMRASGQIAAITRHHLVPQLLLITMKTPWFVAFDMIGTIAFAISGVLIARRERYDIIGACVLAALPAVGGGVMRDMIVTRSPIGIIQTPMLLFLVLGTVIVGTVLFFLHDWLFKPSTRQSPGKPDTRWVSSRKALEVCDAIGLATFTIIGVMVAVEHRCEPLWLWGPLLGALTAAGGGVLRDVLRSQSDIPTLKGTIYPEIAIFWAWIYSLIIIYRGQDFALREVLLLTTGIMLAIFLTRLLVIHYGWKSIFLGRAAPSV